MELRTVSCISLLLTCFTAGAALGHSPRTSRSPERLKSRIPRTIWVTGEWSENSTEVNRTIQHNYNYGHVFRSEDALRWQVENKFAKWAPVGSYIRYFTNDDMDESV